MKNNKQKRINNTLIFLTTLASVCFFVRDLNIGAYDRLAANITIIVVLLIPRAMTKIFKIKFSDMMELVYIIFIILSQLIGSGLNVYNTTWWYDLFTHGLSGILTAILAFVVLTWFNIYNEKKVAFNAFFSVAFTLTVASVWEFLEYGAYILTGMDVQHTLDTGVVDTMEDMLIAFAGALVIAIVYVIEKKHNKTNFFKKIVS